MEISKNIRDKAETNREKLRQICPSDEGTLEVLGDIMSDGVNMDRKSPRHRITRHQVIRVAISVVLYLFATIIQILFDQGALSITGITSNLILMSFYLLPSMILTGFCGIVPAMLSFVCVFIYKWFVRANVAYAESIILMSDIVLYYYIRSGRMKNLKKTFLFTIWYIGMVGPVWNFLVILLEGRLISELEPVEFLSVYVNSIPQCTIAVFLIWLYLNKAPNRFRHYTTMGVYYTDDYDCDFNVRSTSRISRRITQLITLEGIVLGVSAAIFANSLIPEIADNISKDMTHGFFHDYLSDSADMESEGSVDDVGLGIVIQDEGDESHELSGEDILKIQQQKVAEAIEGEEKDPRFLMNRRGVAFDLKLILLIMCVAIPFIILANFYAQRYIAIPITRMASKMREFCEAPQEEKEERLTEVHDLDIKNKDEIGELYGTIDNMATNITSFVDNVIREQKLEEDLRVAQMASETKTAFLNNMSHDIRTPINAVLGLDEMILREAKDDEILKYATDIQNAGKTLLGLVNDILDSSKLEAGKMEILPVEYDLASMVNDLINMIEVKAKDKGLELIIKVDETMPYLLYGDEIRIKQVITNILSNAVKYTEKGSVTLCIGFKKTSEESIDLEVSVADTGIGIKEEDLNKLFAPFERIEESRNRSIEGTGLGMSIVKNLLSLMDSELSVQSVYGEGSTFSFAISQRVIKWDGIGDISEAYERSKDSHKEYHERFRAPDAHILIIDDTPMNLTVATALLKQTRIQIDTGESGFEMLEMIKHKKYDMIFLDHRMPKMDGIETLAAMKEQGDPMNADTPVIALTANAISGARETYLSAGFTDYLSKPIDGAKFEKMIEKNLPPEKVLHEGDEGYGESDEATDPSLKGENQVSSRLRHFFEGTTLIDLDAAVKACNGEEIFEAALKDFLLAIPNKSKDIELSEEKRDYDNYTVLVHALKSSARLVGASALSLQAEEMEKAGDKAKDGDEDAMHLIETKTPELLVLYRSYFDKLGTMFMADDEDVRPEISEDELTEAMNAIREFALAFDFDSADSVMSMLRDYRIPDRYANDLEEVRTQLAAVDQASLLKALERFS